MTTMIPDKRTSALPPNFACATGRQSDEEPGQQLTRFNSSIEQTGARINSLVLITTLGGPIAADCSRCRSQRNLRIRHGQAPSIRASPQVYSVAAGVRGYVAVIVFEAAALRLTTNLNLVGS